LNRWVLVFCMPLSFGLPLVPIPQQWAFRESTAPTANTQVDAVNGYTQNVVAQKRAAIKAAITASTKANAAPKINRAAVKTAPLANVVQAPLIKTSIPATVNTAPLLSRIIKWLFYVYWIGVAAFGLNLLLQLVVLLFQAYTKPVIKDGKFRIIELTGDKAPCSFGNNIFINPEKYDWETYSQILLHEKIHIRQGHSFDILIAELVLVMQWFNPFAWLYRTEVESNLEFLTDDAVLEHKEIERSSYQMSLLKVSAPHLSLGITTNYNQSLLKRRILMMNSKKSNIHIMWKYFFLVPLLGILACALNDPQVYAQMVKTKVKSHSNTQRWSNNNETEGSWFATIKNDKVKIEFRSDSDEHNWSSNSNFMLSEFSALPRDKKGDFTLTREAGTITFNGKFDGNQGYGHYKFKANAEFKNTLTGYGITGVEEGDEFAFFIINIKKDYIIMLEGNGFKHLTKDELISMGALKVDAPYIRFWKEMGYTLTPDELVSGKALGINSEYVSEIRKAGYTHITFEQLVSFKATGVTGKYIAGLHGADVKINNSGHVANKLSADEVVSVKALNVDEPYVSGIQKAGYTNVSLNELTSMKAVGVTPEYIESFRAAGYKNISADGLVSLRSLGVTPEFVKSFAALGYKNISPDDLSSMKAVGVTPQFIESLQAAGYHNISVDHLISIKSLGITPEYAKSFEAAGIKNIPIDELSSIKALGITPQYIQSFRDIGYKNISVDHISSLKALGITPDFIEGFRKIGYNNISLDQATSLKAMGVTPDYVTQMREKGFKSDDLNKYIELKSAFR
ncbi:MAG: M56 family metallopeptidase, partial [Bacteroidota bacterium]|nr:M56 family metallopeptidase [Bacteroidota bacterium]